MIKFNKIILATLCAVGLISSLNAETTWAKHFAKQKGDIVNVTSKAMLKIINEISDQINTAKGKAGGDNNAVTTALNDLETALTKNTLAHKVGLPDDLVSGTTDIITGSEKYKSVFTAFTTDIPKAINALNTAIKTNIVLTAAQQIAAIKLLEENILDKMKETVKFFATKQKSLDRLIELSGLTSLAKIDLVAKRVEVPERKPGKVVTAQVKKVAPPIPVIKPVVVVPPAGATLQQKELTRLENLYNVDAAKIAIGLTNGELTYNPLTLVQRTAIFKPADDAAKAIKVLIDAAKKDAIFKNEAKLITDNKKIKDKIEGFAGTEVEEAGLAGLVKYSVEFAKIATSVYKDLAEKGTDGFTLEELINDGGKIAIETTKPTYAEGDGERGLLREALKDHKKTVDDFITKATDETMVGLRNEIANYKAHFTNPAHDDANLSFKKCIEDIKTLWTAVKPVVVVGGPGVGGAGVGGGVKTLLQEINEAKLSAIEDPEAQNLKALLGKFFTNLADGEIDKAIRTEAITINLAKKLISLFPSGRFQTKLPEPGDVAAFEKFKELAGLSDNFASDTEKAEKARTIIELSLRTTKHDGASKNGFDAAVRAFKTANP